MIGSITRLAAPGVFFGMAHKSVREALSRETASFAVTEKRRGLAMTVLAWEKEVGTVAYGVGQFIQVNVRFVHFPRGCRKKME
jgi:hypothetical protein